MRPLTTYEQITSGMDASGMRRWTAIELTSIEMRRCPTGSPERHALQRLWLTLLQAQREQKEFDQEVKAWSRERGSMPLDPEALAEIGRALASGKLILQRAA